MNPEIIGLICICIFLVLMLLRMPAGLCMALLGFVGFSWIRGTGPALHMLSSTAVEHASSYTMGAIPLYVFMGSLAAYWGLGKAAFSGFNAWIGHWRGGICMANSIGCTFFGAISSGGMAAVAAALPSTLPEMRKLKYDDGLSLGSLAASAHIGALVPPSVLFILYAILTQESIGALFMAGILPGLLLTTLFITTIYLLCRIKPSLAPKAPKASWRERFIGLKNIWMIVALFLIVLGGIYAGVFTPIEGAAVGSFVAFVLGLVSRQLKWSGFKTCLYETGRTTGMIFLLIIGAMIFSDFIAISTIPAKLADGIMALNLPRYGVLAGVLIFYILTGFFMDIYAVVIITVPIFYPLLMTMGFDSVWFGVLVVLTIVIGMLTPPFGMQVFFVAGLQKDVPLYTIFRGVAPFVTAMVVCMILIILFPQIALWIPSMMLPYR